MKGTITRRAVQAEHPASFYLFFTSVTNVHNFPWPYNTVTSIPEERREVLCLPSLCFFICKMGLVRALHSPGAPLVAQMVKNPPAMWETRVQSLGGEDPLKKGTATHSSILAWRIPWPEEPGGLQCMGSQRVRHDWVTNTFLTAQGQEPGCDKHAGRGESCPEGASVLVMHGWGHILALP